MEATAMDPLLTSLLVRFFERLTAVLIGGMAIYLGFRLFLNVPRQKDSTGKVKLPWDISVALSRVGPGAFFALFGVVAVSLTFVRPLELYSPPSGDADPVSDQLRYASGNLTPDERIRRADQRVLLQREMAVLNEIPGMLSSEIAAHDRSDVEISLSRVKLALLKPVWGDQGEGFGDFTAFESWVLSGEPEPPPADMGGALAVYRYGKADGR
jgi:hypothetical protein